MKVAFEWLRFVLGGSFSGFNVLMRTPNPEKDSLLGQAAPIQRHLQFFKLLFFLAPFNYKKQAFNKS